MRIFFLLVVFPKWTMKDAQLQAERLFARCFAKEELDFLHVHPEFIQATRKVECLKDAVEAIDVGDRIIRRSFPYTMASSPTVPQWSRLDSDSRQLPLSFRPGARSRG